MFYVQVRFLSEERHKKRFLSARDMLEQAVENAKRAQGYAHSKFAAKIIRKIQAYHQMTDEQKYEMAFLPQQPIQNMMV